jgi:hypothetical protein
MSNIINIERIEGQPTYDLQKYMLYGSNNTINQLNDTSTANFTQAQTLVNNMIKTTGSKISFNKTSTVTLNKDTLNQANWHIQQGIYILIQIKKMQEKAVKKMQEKAAPSPNGENNNTQRGGRNKKDKDRKKVRGGAVPDYINNVAAFQNVGGLLATASPLDNAVNGVGALPYPGSFNAGLNVPTSGAGLPDLYNLVIGPQTAGPSAQSGGKSKNNRNKDNNKDNDNKKEKKGGDNKNNDNDNKKDKKNRK